VQRRCEEPIISKTQVAKIMGVSVGVTALGYGIHTYKRELACTVALVVGAPYITCMGNMLLQAGPHIIAACASLLALLSPKSSQVAGAVASSAAQPVVDKVYAGPNMLNEIAQERLKKILKHIAPDL